MLFAGREPMASVIGYTAVGHRTASLYPARARKVSTSHAEFWRIQLPRGRESVAEFARIQSARLARAEKPTLIVVPVPRTATQFARRYTFSAAGTTNGAR